MGAHQTLLKNFIRTISFASLLIFVLSACSTMIPRSGEAPLTSEWKKGNFHVLFQAGPRCQDGTTYSFYEITYTSVSQQEQELVMGSAHSKWPFVGSGIDSRPEEYIRVVADPNGKALLIEEEIPNDCGPCSNFLWIHVDFNGLVEGEYLLLPLNETGPREGINYEYPKVRSLDGDVLKYEYTTGPTMTKHIGQIGKSDRPTPPG